MRFARLVLALVLASAAEAANHGTVPLVQERAGVLHVAARLPAAEAESEFRRPRGAIAALLAAVRPGAPRVRGPLTVLPLVATGVSAPPPLQDAAGAVWAIDGAAAYQRLQTQDGTRLALLGQVLRGEKTQDRTVERTMVVPGGEGVDVAAYCCEEKFVARAGERLEMTGHLVPGAVRTEVALALRAELEPLGSAAVVHRSFGSQRAVWKEIGNRIGAAQVSSPYLAFLDLVPARPSELGTFAAAPLPAGTVGLAIGIGERLVAVECMGDPAAMGRWAPELIASWADLGWASPAAARPQDVEAALASVIGAAPAVEAMMPDDGAVTVAVRGGGMRGLGTTVRGAVAHLLLVP